MFAIVYPHLGPGLDTWLARRTAGRFAPRVYGTPGLILHTTGARTGRERITPLIYPGVAACRRRSGGRVPRIFLLHPDSRAVPAVEAPGPSRPVC
ncbi:nitroreductase/quinone reductase family protein [Pseudonocardia sp. RS010]|uniref:nitroreductase/quinone reductase family protein n=1 Tax=Pseudonocardia sp. RS010 TaxID=3385979 RepID=UPI0039A0CA08